jgi:hypothetical protein
MRILPHGTIHPTQVRTDTQEEGGLNLTRMKIVRLPAGSGQCPFKGTIKTGVEEIQDRRADFITEVTNRILEGLLVRSVAADDQQGFHSSTLKAVDGVPDDRHEGVEAEAQRPGIVPPDPGVTEGKGRQEKAGTPFGNTTGDLLGQEGVRRERKMRTVLLGRTKREDRHRIVFQIIGDLRPRGCGCIEIRITGMSVHR